MFMSHFWCLCAIASALAALYTRAGSETGTALLQGAASAITVSLSIAGPLSLWSGLGNLMEKLGMNSYLYKPLKPLLKKLYPSAKHDPQLAGALSANICANLLGLGNAATPMGIQAVKRLLDSSNPSRATDEMCRLVVMNTASIQLIPTTVAAVRTGAGCSSPLDILPCVWISSVLSVGAGLIAAALLRRLWKNA